MNIKHFKDFLDKDRRKKEKIKAAQVLAAGMSVAAVAGLASGIALAPKSGKETMQDLKEKIASEIETVKDNTALASQEISKVIKNAKKRSEEVKADIKDGSHEIKNDIKEVVEEISL